MKNSIRNLLVSSLCVGSLLGLTSCQDKPGEDKSQYISGKVIEEYGNLPQMVNSQNVTNNQSIPLRDSEEVYGIKVETNEGIYNIQISPFHEVASDSLAYSHTRYNLEASIEKGSYVLFPKEDFFGNNVFPIDKIGALGPRNIIVEYTPEKTPEKVLEKAN